jgi:hypothetical protein
LGYRFTVNILEVKAGLAHTNAFKLPANTK